MNPINEFEFFANQHKIQIHNNEVSFNNELWRKPN